MVTPRYSTTIHSIVVVEKTAICFRMSWVCVCLQTGFLQEVLCVPKATGHIALSAKIWLTSVVINMICRNRQTRVLNLSKNIAFSFTSENITCIHITQVNPESMRTTQQFGSLKQNKNKLSQSRCDNITLLVIQRIGPVIQRYEFKWHLSTWAISIHLTKKC